MDSANPVILFLVGVGVALVGAAFYALFGRPSTSQGKKRRQEVIDGFQKAGGILLGFVLMGGFVAFTGIALGTTSSLLLVSRFFAGALAVSALIVIGLMIQRWAKYFAGWIAWGIFNSLLMASSGHLLNNPAIPVKRTVALTLAGLCLVTVLVSRRFTKTYQLKLADKVALLAWIVSFALGVNMERFSIPALAAGTFALVIAWSSNRSTSRRRSHGRAPRHEATLDPPASY